MGRCGSATTRVMVGAVVPALALGACSARDSSAAPRTSTATQRASSAPAPASSGSVAATDAHPSGMLPVYWIGDTRRSTFLYREFVPRSTGSDDVTAAVSAMTARRPGNPAWRTLWRHPQRLKVRRTGNAITVDLSADAFGAAGVSARQASKSIQQLVWTATAAAGSQAPVTVLVDGRKGYRAWGAVTLGAPMRRTPTARAPIWVDTPVQGAAVKHGRVAVQGSANVLEGNVVIMVKDAAGRMVMRTAAQGGSGTYRPYRTTVQLPKPGRYTLTAYEPDESEGEGGEGPYPYAVTTTFTVR